MQVAPESRVDQQIEAGAPRLPAACLVRLTPIARQRVLLELKLVAGKSRPALADMLRGQVAWRSDLLDWRLASH